MTSTEFSFEAFDNLVVPIILSAVSTALNEQHFFIAVRDRVMLVVIVASLSQRLHRLMTPR